MLAPKISYHPLLEKKIYFNLEKQVNVNDKSISLKRKKFYGYFMLGLIVIK